MIDRVRTRLSASWRSVRFAAWARKARRDLARGGCDLQVVAPYGATFDTPPAVEVTRHMLGDTGRPGRGHVRLEFGRDVHLGRHTVIEVLPTADAVLRLDDGVVCFAGARFVLFGGDIRVGRATRIRDGVTLKSSGHLDIGEYGFVNNFSIVHCAREVILGDHPQVAERVTIIDSDHRADGSDVYAQLLPIDVEPVHVGRNVWIGANAVVLRGARLGANSVVAANSTVRGGDYPAGWLVAGVPATARRPLTAEEAEPT